MRVSLLVIVSGTVRAVPDCRVAKNACPALRPQRGKACAYAVKTMHAGKIRQEGNPCRCVKRKTPRSRYRAGAGVAAIDLMAAFLQELPSQ
ncbi:MAG: hypothetical protein K6F46_07715 [Desulfovibrio sp.]|nr:hypothetical protein [Desulfovibrio sp.]